uniref:LPS-assembly protein LptD n=1 Tax=candidate division WOR-3 bacterium TaxID=2052148 RepID=A0A7V3ZYP1_UNCW3
MNLISFLIFVSSPLYFECKEILYFADSSIFILRDSSKIKKDNVELLADSIIFYKNEDKLKAFGNKAILIFGTDTLVGDSIYYNTRTKNGFAFTGKMRQEKGIYQGAKIAKDSTDTIYVKKGTFTTCEADIPHYYFESSESKVILRDMAIVKPVILKVHDIPVFLLPFWIFPLSKERKSGFLVPRFGTNSTDGKYFRNLSYYLVLNNYSDLTFSLDLFEKRGIRGNIELAFNRYRFGNLNLNYSLAQEWTPWRRRWTLNTNTTIGPFKGFRITGKGEYLSDNEVLNDYADVKENWLKRELSSYLSISKNFGRVAFSGILEDRLNLTTNRRTTRIPSIQVGLPHIKYGNFGLTGNIAFLREYSQIDTLNIKRWGAKFSGSASYNFRLFKFLRFSLTTYGFAGIADHDTSRNKYPVIKGFSYSANSGTVLYGKTVFGIGKIKFFTHTLQPSLSFSYQPEIENPQTNFYFLQYSSKERATLNVSLNNSFGVQLEKRKVDVINVNLSSSATILPKDSLPFFNNWFISVNTLTILPFSIRLTTTYLRETKEFKNPSVNLSLRTSLPLPFFNLEQTDTRNKISLSLNYTLTKGIFISQMLYANGNFDFGKSFRVSFSGSYDFDKKEVVSKSFSISKDLHCWEANLTYNSFGDRWDYNFKIYIKKLPDVKIEKSIFDLFLP